MPTNDDLQRQIVELRLRMDQQHDSNAASIDFLVKREISTVMGDRLPPRGDQYRLQLRIESFERVRTASGWVVRAGFEARLDKPGELLPRLKKTYALERPAGADIQSSVDAMATVLDQVYAQLAIDIAAAGSNQGS